MRQQHGRHYGEVAWHKTEPERNAVELRSFFARRPLRRQSSVMGNMSADHQAIPALCAHRFYAHCDKARNVFGHKLCGACAAAFFGDDPSAKGISRHQPEKLKAFAHLRRWYASEPVACLTQPLAPDAGIQPQKKAREEGGVDERLPEMGREAPTSKNAGHVFEPGPVHSHGREARARARSRTRSSRGSNAVQASSHDRPHLGQRRKTPHQLRRARIALEGTGSRTGLVQ